ncbi:MAG: efflux RND transporter periplasmic adaptor subunit [Acidobacteriota bacterium]
MKRFAKWIVTLGVLGGIGYGAYRYYAAPAEIKFIKAVITRGSIESVISATGTLSATLSVNVGSQVSGNVLEMLADFNTPVRKGQLIAVIDPSTYQTKVDQAQASLNSAETQIKTAEVAEKRADFDIATAELAIVNQKASVNRAQSQVAEAKRQLEIAKNSYTGGFGTKDAQDSKQATYDQAVLSVDSAIATQKTSEASLASTKAQKEVVLTQKTTAASQVTNAKAALESAELDLSRTKILAPVDGIVIARNMSPGQTVQASTSAPQLFEIAQDLSQMHVDVNIDESDISRVQIGQQASFTVDAYPGQTFRGDVLQVRHSPTNVQNVITYTVVILVDNRDMRLFPGMTAQTRIVSERVESTLRVPSAALRFRPPAQLADKVVGDVGGKGKGKAGSATDKTGDATKSGATPASGKETGSTKADAPVTARVKGTAPQANSEVASTGDDGTGKRRRGRGGDGGGGDASVLADASGGDGTAKAFDRSKFQGKNFDPSQFKGRNGGTGGGTGKTFDRSQFQGKNGGGAGGRAGGAGGGAGAGAGRAGGGRSGGGQAGAPAGGVRAVIQTQTVYRINDKGELEGVRIRTGISDGTWAALMSNNLQEGAELVTAVEGLPVITNTKANAPGFGGNNNNNGGFPGGGGGGRGGNRGGF